MNCKKATNGQNWVAGNGQVNCPWNPPCTGPNPQKNIGGMHQCHQLSGGNKGGGFRVESFHWGGKYWKGWTWRWGKCAVKQVWVT